MGLAFDGSSTHRAGGTGLVLYDTDDSSISLSFNSNSIALIMNLNMRL